MAPSRSTGSPFCASLNTSKTRLIAAGIPHLPSSADRAIFRGEGCLCSVSGGTRHPLLARVGTRQKRISCADGKTPMVGVNTVFMVCRRRLNSTRLRTNAVRGLNVQCCIFRACSRHISFLLQILCAAKIRQFVPSRQSNHWWQWRGFREDLRRQGNPRRQTPNLRCSVG